MTETTLKSNRGRPRAVERKDDWHVSIEPDLSVYFRLKHVDEFTKLTKKGALSALVNRLLREEMRRQQGATS